MFDSFQDLSSKLAATGYLLLKSLRFLALRSPNDSRRRPNQQTARPERSQAPSLPHEPMSKERTESSS
jgi:hypothetical protein